LDELSYNLQCIYVIPLSIAEVDCKCKTPVEVDCPEATRENMGSVATPAAPFRLDGKVALVTGAGRGIGAEMALQLARCGARVVINYKRSAQSAEKVVQEIKGLGSDAVAIQADVSKVPEIVRLFDDAVKHFGQLDIVCSNSGVVSFGHLEDVTEASFVDVGPLNGGLTGLTGRI
jgi:hypothetical protein